MKIKNVNLEYWVFYWDFNKLEPIRENILNGINEKIAKCIRSSKNSWKHIANKNDLIQFLKTEFMHRYWCKSEREYLISSLWAGDYEKGSKKDVYYQIEPNLEMIADYIIYKMKIDFKEK